jgi:hypothetical protein
MSNPAESKFTYSMKRPRYMSEAEYAQKIYNDFCAARMFDQKNAERCFHNNRLYWSVDTDKGLGQIASAVVSEMIRIGKQPGAFNICKPVVDNVVGGFLQAPLSFDLRPIRGEVSTLTYSVKDMMFAEAEEMDWDVTESETLISGCVYRADVQMYLDRSDPLQTMIGWRVLPDGSVIWPPHLSSKHKERRKCYYRRMMSPLDMLEFFSFNKHKIVQAVMYKQFGEDAVKEWAKLQEQYGDQYGPNSGVVPYSNNEKMWGNEYEVVLFYHMERITRQFEYVLTEDNEKIEIPKDLSDAMQKIEWLNANAPGWVPDAVFVDDEDIDVQYMTAICPELGTNMLLCDGPTDEQCGMLTIAPWSAYFKNGEFGGLIDAIKDIQLSLNWIQNTLQYRLHIDGEGTSWYVFPEAFADGEYERWVDCKNKAGEAFKMKPGMEVKYPNGPAIPVQKSPYPKEAADRVEHLLDKLLPLIGKYTPASRGQVENSGESGYLFNLKKLQNDVERKIMFESRRQFKNLQGEMYLGQVIRLRGDRFEREFYNSKSGNKFKINERVTETLPTGEVIESIVNDISKLKTYRHKIVIVETPDSPTRRAENMQIASEQIRAIPNPNAVPISYVTLVHSMLRGAENISDEEKMQQDEIFQLELDLAKSTAEAQIANNKAAIVKAQMSIQPQPPQVPGMPGVPTGEGSVPGGIPAGNEQDIGTIQPQELAMA